MAIQFNGFVCKKELECSHEEAGTRILLHAQHAAKAGHGTVIIRSPNTDVAIIACGLAGQISARLILQRDTAQWVRYLDLTAIRAHLGNNVATSLIEMHSMTGCDSTSAISRRRKSSAFELLKTSLPEHNVIIGQFISRQRAAA